MIILDTNVISELMRPEAEPFVVKWVASQIAEDFVTTAVTKAEILFGVRILPQGKRSAKLEAEAERIFSIDLGGRIISFDSDAAEIFAELGATRRRAGKPMSEADCQIAAIARLHGAAFATRNTKDFEGCGVKLINPWKRS